MRKFYLLLPFFILSCVPFPKIEVKYQKCVDSVSVVFSGDLMQHIPQVNAARTQEGGFDYSVCFESLSKLWKSADFAVVNLETTIASNPPYSGYPMFCSPKELLEAVKSAGVDVLALANNHICDKGRDGLSNTLYVAHKQELKTIGVSVDSLKNYTILEKNNMKVVILNYTFGTNGMPIPKGFKVNLIDTVDVINTLNEIRKNPVDKVIVMFHWGDEYQLVPNKNQVAIGKWCVNNGIDFVVGSHPHVAQPIDTANKIVYSLGNLVSNQSGRYKDGGLSVKLTIFKDSIRCQYVPHWVDKVGRYRVLLPVDTLTNKSSVFVNSLDDTRSIVRNAKELIL